MSKHVFTIEADFDSGAEYEEFVMSLSRFGAEITNEESDF